MLQFTVVFLCERLLKQDRFQMEENVSEAVKWDQPQCGTYILITPCSIKTRVFNGHGDPVSSQQQLLPPAKLITMLVLCWFLSMN